MLRFAAPPPLTIVAEAMLRVPEPAKSFCNTLMVTGLPGEVSAQSSLAVTALPEPQLPVTVMVAGAETIPLWS